MASINEVAGFAEPLRSYNFQVYFPDSLNQSQGTTLNITPNEAIYQAKSIDIPSWMTLDTEKIRLAPTFDMEYPSGFKNEDSLTIEFWEDEQRSIMRRVKTWFQQIINMDPTDPYYMTFNLKSEYVRDIMISILTVDNMVTQIGATSAFETNITGENGPVTRSQTPTSFTNSQGIGGIASKVSSVIGAASGIANAIKGSSQINSGLNMVSKGVSTVSKVAGTINSINNINSIGGALGAVGTLSSGVSSITSGLGGNANKIGSIAGQVGTVSGILSSLFGGGSNLSNPNITAPTSTNCCSVRVVNAYPVSVDSIKFEYGENELVLIKVKFNFENIEWL